MLLATVAAASKQLAETPSRKGKTLILATLLSALSTAEITPVVSWLSGELTQRQIGVGWASLRQLPQPSERPTLTVEQTESAFTAIGTLRGPGSRTRREELLRSLFEQADELETRFLRALLGGELRQGALKAQMLDAIATAAAIDIATVRRAAMLLGDTAHVAALALAGDVTALHNVCLHVGRPVAPMLASPGSSVSQALETPGEYAFERKLDGARIQVHRDGEQVTVFTRTLDDVTARLGEIVAAVRALPVTSIVLDGEAMALRTDGRPAPFQVTASRFGSRNSSEPSLSAFYFDLLHLDGVDLIDVPASQRFALLDKVIPQDQRVQRIITDQVAEAQEFLDSALADGYEGVVVKSLHAGYDAGRRGAAWRKIKPVHSLDLVVLAVEHGSGRRRGTLSNIHLGARDGDTGEFVMLGKTFKGMTDEMLVWQTQRFTELATGPTDGWVVPLRAEQVVEIAFDSVQRSSRYPAGVTLRFARVLRYRDDKSAADIDTVQSVQAMLPQ